MYLLYHKANFKSENRYRTPYNMTYFMLKGWQVRSMKFGSLDNKKTECINALGCVLLRFNAYVYAGRANSH